MPAPTLASPGPMHGLRLRMDGRLRQNLKLTHRERQHGGASRSQRLSGSVGAGVGLSVQQGIGKGDGPLPARSKLNPNDAELLAEMSNLLVYIGQPKQAIDQVKEAIRLNPNHERWYVEYLGWAYEDAGMPQRSDRDFRTVDTSKSTG